MRGFLGKSSHPFVSRLFNGRFDIMEYSTFYRSSIRSVMSQKVRNKHMHDN